MCLHTIASHGLIQTEILDDEGHVVGQVLPAVRERLLAQGMPEKYDVIEDDRSLDTATPF
jgi:hypothetical protein